MLRTDVSRWNPGRLVAACLAAAVLAAACSSASREKRPDATGCMTLDQGVTALAGGIASDTADGPRVRIAVIEFLDLKQQENELGALVAEGLVSQLSQGERFELVERSLINRVFQEQAFSAQDAVDAETAQELGQLLGVEAILSGTIADLGDRLTVHARLIDTGTGKVLAAESVHLERTEPVLALYRSTDGKPATTEGRGKEAQDATAASASALAAETASQPARAASPTPPATTPPPLADTAAAPSRTGTDGEPKIRAVGTVPCPDQVPSRTVREKAYRKALRQAAEEFLRKHIRNWDALPEARKEQLIRRVAASARVQILQAGKRGNVFAVEILFEPPARPTRE